MNATINKASLKDGLFLKGDYDEQMKDATRNVKFDDSSPVHDDLKVVFDSLGDHLRRLCEQPIDFEGENSYTCTGFTIGGSGAGEGICLIGSRSLPGNRALNLVSPFQKWEEDNYHYDGIDELSDLIETAKQEVKAYLFDGKHAPEKQLSLFPETGDDDVNVAGKETPLGEPAKVKRGRKKKVEDSEPSEPEQTEEF